MRAQADRLFGLATGYSLEVVDLDSGELDDVEALSASEPSFGEVNPAAAQIEGAELAVATSEAMIELYATSSATIA